MNGQMIERLYMSIYVYIIDSNRAKVSYSDMF